MQRLLLISAASIFTLDQITKYLVVFYMNLIERGANERLARLHSLSHGLEQRHQLWSIFQQRPRSALDLDCHSTRHLRRRDLLDAPRNPPIALMSAGMVIGGALGNAVDRESYMAVSQIFSTSPAAGCAIPSHSMWLTLLFLPVSWV